ncbi:MAG: sulfite exporter TauE/SafE family protein, partial [Inquilinus sp.]|nr:sulfite exporter TauE/SafE family protein [Inquilinus sp.]
MVDQVDRVDRVGRRGRHLVRRTSRFHYRAADRRVDRNRPAAERHADREAPRLIDDPWFYAAALPAVLIAGISKGGFGGGVGLVAVPLMALTVAPPQAAAIMLPILCFMDVFGVWAYRRRWDWRILRIVVPAALIGIAAGAASFRYLNADAIRLMLGLIAVGFTVRYWLRQARGEGK